MNLCCCKKSYIYKKKYLLGNWELKYWDQNIRHCNQKDVFFWVEMKEKRHFWEWHFKEKFYYCISQICLFVCALFKAIFLTWHQVGINPIKLKITETLIFCTKPDCLVIRELIKCFRNAIVYYCRITEKYSILKFYRIGLKIMSLNYRKNDFSVVNLTVWK